MNPFDPYSNPNSPLFGRQDDIEEILSLLDGVNHVSVVAPKFFGKRALLREIATRAKADSSFDGVVLWDMKATPTKADTFFADLAQQIWDQWAHAGEYFKGGISGVTGESLIRKSKDWRDMEQRVLLVWMSFDEVLRDPELPDNFLSQLRNLCSSQGVRILASTRREMPELVVNQADIGSTLWGQFKVHPLGTLSNEDWAALTVECDKQGLKFAPGADVSVNEQTGRSPPILFTLLGHLVGSTAPITKNDVAEAADEIDTRVLKDLWKDLGSDSQRFMRQVARNKEGVSEAGVSDSLFEPLTKRLCVVRKVSGRFLPTSKIFAAFAARQEEADGQLAILFGQTSNYLRNIAATLKLRFAQVKMPMSGELRTLVTTLLTNLGECSSVSLNSIRQIFSGTASIVFDRQFKDGRIPDALVAEWKGEERRLPACASNQRVPRARHEQIELIRRLDDGLKLKPQQAGPLFDLLYKAGNRAQHDDEHEPVTEPFAIAVSTTVIELLVLLDQSK